MLEIFLSAYFFNDWDDTFYVYKDVKKAGKTILQYGYVPLSDICPIFGTARPSYLTKRIAAPRKLLPNFHTLAKSIRPTLYPTFGPCPVLRTFSSDKVCD